MSLFSQLSDDFVRCRTLLHAWEESDEQFPEIQDAYKSSGSVEKIVFHCVRCDGYRIEGWSRVTGDLLWRAYRLPKKYRLPKGANATRKKMRREFIERRRNNVKWEAPAPRRNGRKAG